MSLKCSVSKLVYVSPVSYLKKAKGKNTYAKQKHKRDFEESVQHSGAEYCNTRDEKHTGCDCLPIKLHTDLAQRLPGV